MALSLANTNVVRKVAGQVVTCGIRLEGKAFTLWMWETIAAAVLLLLNADVLVWSVNVSLMKEILTDISVIWETIFLDSTDYGVVIVVTGSIISIMLSRLQENVDISQA